MFSDEHKDHSNPRGLVPRDLRLAYTAVRRANAYLASTGGSYMRFIVEEPSVEIFDLNTKEFVDLDAVLATLPEEDRKEILWNA